MFENVVHVLVTHGISEVGQSAANPVVAPGAIFPCRAHHQCLQLWVDRGTPRCLALLGAVEFLGHKLTVPTKHCVQWESEFEYFDYTGTQD